MRIYWDPDKNRKLLQERGIGFETVADIILNEDYLEILPHPKKKDQWLFVVILEGYVHAVPFVTDENDGICLKTVFPSRKLHRKYGRQENEK